MAHPLRVAVTARHVFGIDDPIVLATACLHDVIEDTTTDYDELVSSWGKRWLRSSPRSPKTPVYRTTSVSGSMMAIRSGSWRAKLIKLADVLDNVSDSRNTQERTKAAEKAKRAIACAGNDERLRPAIEAVRGLLGG